MTQTDTRDSLSGGEARRELYALLHQSTPPKAALERVLDIGSRYLDVDHGHVTDIDEAENRWEVTSSTDPPEGPYPEGLSADLSSSYCRRTIQQSSPLALDDAGNQGWADDHAYRLHQLDTYLGIRVDVFDEPYGTICFVGKDARDEPFSEAELIFTELAAEVLRQILEHSYHEKSLANRDRLIAVLNRVLRHNLRNDLNVVHGYAVMLRQCTSGDETRWAQTIESTTTELLTLAEKSRQLEYLTRSVPISRPTDIMPIVDDAVANVRTNYPTATLSLDAPDEALVFASPQFSEAVSELLENAARFSGENPEIEVDVRTEGDETTVEVSDDGPGLPADEQRILTGGDEQPLAHGSGLGLVLVFWVMSNLDGEIDVTTSSTGTTIELRLERAPTVSPSSGTLDE